MRTSHRGHRGAWLRPLLAALGVAGAGALAAGALSLGACRQEYNINVQNARSGLNTRDLKVGGGMEVREGCEVEAHYIGRLPDGTVVIDTRRDGKSHRWIVGDRTVIAGMDKGVVGMRAGGKREITMSPSWHYGKAGYGGVIPPNTRLVFEVEILSARSS